VVEYYYIKKKEGEKKKDKGGDDMVLLVSKEVDFNNESAWYLDISASNHVWLQILVYRDRRDYGWSC
jgi:hypothetical protein